MKILTHKKYLSHPWSEFGLVENISLLFLLSISNQNSTDVTDLLDGTIVHQDLVWQDIKNNGMVEPLLIRINPVTKEVRLESGNHRIKTAIADGYTHLPCASFITKNTIAYEGNGIHKKEIPDLLKWDFLINSSYDYQIKISNYLNQQFLDIVYDNPKT